MMFRAEKAVEGWGKEVLIWETGLDRHESLGHRHTVYRIPYSRSYIRHPSLSVIKSYENIVSFQHLYTYHQSSPYTDHPSSTCK